MSKVFISYCHENEKFFDENLKSLFEDLQTQNGIEYFYDRKLQAGGGLFDSIDFHIKDCDFAILLLSESFYKSDACQKEKKDLLIRKNLEGIYLLPLVVSDCDWLADKSISTDLLLNTDGKPLDSLNENELDKEKELIKQRLIKIDADIQKIKNLELTENFNDFLEDTDVFKTSHRSRNTLLLSDIYVFPKLRKYKTDDEKDDDIDSEDLFSESEDNKYVFISGDSQSGKTSLLKRYIKKSFEYYFIPLYFDSDEDFNGHIFNIVVKKFKKQFKTDLDDEELKNFLECNKEKVILFLDDFQSITKKEKIIGKINIFSKVICTIDLIYNLDIEIKDIQTDLIKFSIKEFDPKKRNEIIKKWLYLDQDEKIDEPELIKQLDKKTEQIENITGKSLNGGIMPAYPFLILSILSNIETLNRPLTQQITSYGYCYEALIIIAFTKIGLKTDAEIAGCINFLSKFAYKLYKENQNEMNGIDFLNFLDEYEQEIALPFKKDLFIKKLVTSRLLMKSTLGNYRFDYKYIYYYFVAKYLSENSDNALNEIKFLISNIHNDANAYIVLFFSHNNKSNDFYQILLTEANSLFEKNNEITLSKDDTKFFDTSYKALLEVVLPSKNHNYKNERDNRLNRKSEKEYSSIDDSSLDSLTDDYSKNLRKSIKLVETLGLISKNRYTSVSKDKINELLKSAIDLNFRGLDAFFALFNNEESQKELIDYFAEEFKKEISKEKDIDDEKYKQMASKFFWTMNFLYVFVIIQKTIQSIGSENLLPNIKKIAEENPTPANILILEGTKIIYGNNVDNTNLFRYIKDQNFSELSKSILRLFVVDFCKTHPVVHSEIQRLSDNMHIKIEKMKK